jgi:hypothetical protein
VGIFGFLLGSVLKTSETSDQFQRNNQLTVYTNKKMATRAFVDFVYLQTLKGGARIAIRFVAFSGFHIWFEFLVKSLAFFLYICFIKGIIVGSSVIIQAYRNKSNPLDYTVGGG